MAVVDTYTDAPEEICVKQPMLFRLHNQNISIEKQVLGNKRISNKTSIILLQLLLE